MSLLGRFSPSLLTRVAFTLALVALVPVVLLAARLMGVNRDAMNDQVQRTHLLTARKTAEGIGAFLETQISLAQGLASNPALRDPKSQPARVLLSENLQAWVGLGVLGLAVVDPRGEQVILAQLVEDGVPARVATAFERPAEGRIVAFGGPGEFVVRVRSPLAEAEGELWLISDGSLLVDELEAFELGEEATVALADRGGSILLGSSEEFPQELLDEATGGHIQSFTPRFTVDGDEFLGAQAPVPHTAWTVLSRQPTRVAREAELRMRRQAALAVGIAVLAAAALSVGAYGSVIRPIRQVAQAQRRLAGLRGREAGGDEIEQLRASFEALEERLKAQRTLDEVFLGRYQVLEVIGSGAMGTVFRGWDPKLKRPVALKTVRLGANLESSRRQELISRLLEEAVLVAKFSHPHIVSIFDVEDRAGIAFVAMELVEGASLDHVIWRAGRLDAEQGLTLGAAVASGVAAAHEHGLVHRDIKPANILLGREGAIKVTDFGIAELVSQMSERQDVVFGTPGYLPPEALQGLGFGKQGDLFALGSVLYFSLTGRQPFEGRSIKDVIRQTLYGKLTPLTRLAPGVPPELETIIHSLLERDLKHRPHDAGRVADELARLAASREARWQAPVDLFGPADETKAGDEPSGAAAQFVPTRKITDGRRQPLGR